MNRRILKNSFRTTKSTSIFHSGIPLEKFGRYSRTPYSAEHVKNTRLHRAAARLGVSFPIFISNLTRESDAIILEMGSK